MRRKSIGEMRPIAAVAVLVAMMVMMTMVSAQVAEDGSGSTLDVSGTGSVTVEPEFVRIQVGVDTQNATASAALQENNVLVTNVTVAIGKLGIEDEDVATQSISLSPLTSYNASTGMSTITGFRASNTITIDVYAQDDEVSLADAAGAVLTTLVEEGINSIDSVSFLAKNTTAATDRARELAVRNARQTADIFANAAGYVVSAVQSINVNDFNAPAPVNYRASPSADVALVGEAISTPISSGDITVTSSVSITYTIEPNFAP